MNTIMNERERAFAEENIKTIEKFLSHRRLDYDTYYDVVVFGFLKAVMQYLSVERLQQYAFNTIAWRKMNDEVWRYHRDQNRLKRKAVPLSMDAELESETTSFYELVPDLHGIDFEKQCADKQIIESCMLDVRPQEKTVLMLKAQGYSYREIGTLCNLSCSGVFNRVLRFRKRLKQSNPEISELEMWECAS
uniref:RNA polymerase sigma factor 70 region 4 type 2 domain-containing protein n=1 Tax=uncultured Bacillota bacterium TaxID=344338 RepID=A0A650F4E7_9FIRM|nr:hypothetical protein Firmicute1046_0110 [uncultured Firmicutes bacterium]